jgi:hypothetical protein
VRDTIVVQGRRRDAEEGEEGRREGGARSVVVVDVERCAAKEGEEERRQEGRRAGRRREEAQQEGQEVVPCRVSLDLNETTKQ